MERWKRVLKGRAEFAPYQTAAKKFPHIPVKTFEQSVVLVTGKKFWTGAEAVFRLLALHPRDRWLLSCYQKIPLFKPAAELAYRLVARSRFLFSRIVQICRPGKSCKRS